MLFWVIILYLLYSIILNLFSKCILIILQFMVYSININFIIVNYSIKHNISMMKKFYLSIS